VFLFGRQVVAVVHEIGRRRRLDGGALDQRAPDDRLDDGEELIAGRGDDAVFLQPPGDR
jgi:hypothetical protein